MAVSRAPIPPLIPACIALGSNLGDRHANIQAGLSAINLLQGTRLVRTSQLIATEPVGPIPQPPYLNAAALIETTLSARDVLSHLLAIERACGRDRSLQERWGPRTLDLDLLLYGDAVINEPGLIVPHPRMHERRFVLQPASEIAGDMLVPTMNATVTQLLDRLSTAGRV